MTLGQIVVEMQCFQLNILKTLFSTLIFLYLALGFWHLLLTATKFFFYFHILNYFQSTTAGNEKEMQKHFVVAIAIAAVCIARTFFIWCMTCTMGCVQGLKH